MAVTEARTTPVAPGIDDETARLIGAELVKLIKVLAAMRQHVPTPHPSIDVTHFPVLFQLAQEPRRVSDLAGCVHSDVSTVSRQVTHLVQHGLVRKAPDPQDGRVHLLDLTDEGKTAVSTAITRRGEWLRGVMSDWTEPQAKDLLGYVRRLVDDLEQAKTTPVATAPGA
jgi:DNA-binding MarR family transcriptional regulator